MEEAQHPETGEMLTDEETGEMRQVVYCVRSERRDRDGETGESQVPARRFQVPRILQQQQQNNRGRGRSQSTCIERSMVCGTQNISPVVFMLPTLLFFPAWASILCVICETCIHIWSHKRNKIKGHKVYRSPLHLISSEFCAPCRTDKWMQQISKIQDRRTQRRNMIHPEYMRHVVR